MTAELLTSVFGGGQAALLALIWWELRHVRRTLDDHEARLRKVERRA